MGTDFTKLSLAHVQAELEAIAADAQATFGPLAPRQLNWRPEAARWSVAQCLDHLLKANAEMLDAAAAALGKGQPRSLWQWLPLWPRLMGRLLIRSQSPGASGRYTAPRPAQPTASAIDPAIVARFIGQQRDLLARARALDERAAARVIMVSPFMRVISYSVLDGWRLIVAHERRHVEQARRVTQAPGFPR
jgi:hypothetical protein